MSTVLQFAVLGLGSGAVYALLAQGVVLIYRGSGVINLAHGAFAMFSAYLFNVLHVDHAWATPPALLVAVAVAAGFGLLTDQGLMRNLRQASPLTRLIGTTGVLIILQSIVVLLWGGTPMFVLPLFSTAHVDVLHATVSVDRVWTLGIGVLCTGALVAVWRFTRAGWITEAVSENQRSAAALGWSPELVSSATWAVGAALAGVAGVLVAPITQLDPVNLPLLVIPALAAALVGGFRSYPLTLLGGLLIGVVQAEVGNYVHVTGAQDALPLLMIVIVLIVRGSSLPLRGHISDRLPVVGNGRIDWKVLVPCVMAMSLALLLLTSDDWLSALTATFAVGIVLLSLVVLIGYAGQLSLAQYALAGIGALLAARLVRGAGLPFELAIVGGMAGTVVVGLAFALPALRTRGVNLAVVTLALGLATQSLLFNNPTYVGDQAGLFVGSPHVLGWNVDPLDHPGRYAFVVFACFVLAMLAVANLRRGRAGRRLLAVRANERAAAAAGINVAGAKLYAFAVSGALAGLGGIMFAFQATAITFTAYSPLTSLSAVAQIVIGGVGYVLGPLLGAPLAPASFGSILSLHWSAADSYLPLVGGVGVLVTLIVHPNGLVGRNPVSFLYRKLVPDRQEIPDWVRDPAVARTVVPKTLVVEDLTVRYGAVVAVDGVSLTVRPGEIVGLIGPNGAGKTSLMDAVTGFAGCSGRVRLDDVALDGWPAYRRARAGLVRSFQNLELFPDLTVLENLQAVSDPRDGASLVTDMVRPGNAALPSAAVAAVHEFGLLDSLHRLPDELSYGQRRLLAIARAVAMEPSVLLLDEPVAGLDDRESAEFAHLVKRLASAWGMAVLVIEHDMDFVMGISDRIEVIDFGKPIAGGTPEQVRSDPAAIAAYLGGELDAPASSVSAGEAVTP